MRLGALVLQTQPWGEAAPTWRAIEASGVDTAYVAVLVRMAATLQDVPGGRIVLGLGSGVPADVVADRGSDDPSVDSAEDRFGRYRDVVLGLRAPWSGQPGRVGERLSFSGVETLPHAPGREAPPLLLAAHGARGRDVEEAGAAGFDDLCFSWPTGEPGSRFWADPEVVAEGHRAARR